MQKMLNKKTFFVTLIILGVIFALFALLTPNFGDIAESQEKLLLDKKKVPNFINYRVEVISSSGEDNTSHALGERFRVRYIIHYREDAVRPNFEEVFADTSFVPFELMSEAKIFQRVVDKWEIKRGDVNVVEYIYEVELAIFDALVEDIYYLPSIELDYLVINTGGTGILNLSYAHPLHIADFYGGETDEVDFISAKNVLQDNQATKERLFRYAGYIFAILAILYLFSERRDKIAFERNRQQLSVEQKLMETFQGFANNDWLIQEPAYIRMRALERLAITMAWTFKNLKIADFYQRLSGKDVYFRQRFSGRDLEQLFAFAWSSNKSKVSYKDVSGAFSILSAEYHYVMYPRKNGIRKFFNFRSKRAFKETPEGR